MEACFSKNLHIDTWICAILIIISKVSSKPYLMSEKMEPSYGENLSKITEIVEDGENTRL